MTNKARAKIDGLWDELQTPDGVRQAFAPRWDEVSERTEAFLALHEAEVSRLEARREQLQPLLKLVEKREELLLERTALHSLQKDAGRLLRRGPGAAAERKYENEAMRRVWLRSSRSGSTKLVEGGAEPPVPQGQGTRKMARDKQEAAAERAAPRGQAAGPTARRPAEMTKRTDGAQAHRYGRLPPGGHLDLLVASVVAQSRGGVRPPRSDTHAVGPSREAGAAS